MGLQFIWDPKKARRNYAHHGVSFEEASTVFKDDCAITIPDPLHSVMEERLILLGYSISNRLLVVVHTERGDWIRIISARAATKNERTRYEEEGN